MVSKIDHLGILVDDIERNRTLFEQLGLEVGAIERVPSFGVAIAFIRVGESLVELVEPVDPTTALAAALEGADQTAMLHHIAFRVDDIEQRLGELQRAGVALADETPRQGAGDASVAFLERRAANGVRVELVEREGDLTIR
ncbi:methylmalonyl-CoA epimerase [Natrinema hispanicum]|uniref:Methylmalonyl-CoA epimerase n=1 Tax=Natrinema hispanicum TaxID=392421 RepID=A0A482Y4E8_9EURY|nr:VOC family protein [Natrinema hispanicum]RZV06413.1 methylmalonyl-CoA epimerase [Natrinema hispanicum]